ncbi:hypothetical protein BKI52_01165 [marine bacterium AO1-C]|nr:hypothetical protein BKI52_01165 [marine bacterium AO1-C]
MTATHAYKSFPQYVLRTPLLSVDFYKKFTSGQVISEQSLKAVCQDKIIREAIFLASPSLLFEIDKWLANEMADTKKINRLKDSILKYVSRLCSRCTPFGLFAGCATGNFDDSSSIGIALKQPQANQRHSRLDMNLLVALAQKIAKIPRVRTQVLFFPNSSIYQVANKLRYINYEYIGGKRSHEIVEVEHSDYLEAIFLRAKSGAKLDALVATIDEPEIALEEKQAFIEELIDANLLISELEPSLCGPEFFDQLDEVLHRLKEVDEIVTILKEVRGCLTKIDATIGNDIEHYLHLKTLLDKLGVSLELKFMTQTDMVLQTHQNTLPSKIADSVLKGLSFLNKISLPPATTQLKEFAREFYDRYGERSVPLSKVMDVDIGVGYPKGRDDGDVNPLIDDVALPTQQPKVPQHDIKWNSIQAFFYKKLQEAIKDEVQTVTFKVDDFKNLDENWDDLPDTLSVMAEVVSINGQQKVKFSGSGGSSAANLLGRFAFGEKKLHEHVANIIDKETQMNEGKVLAEIVHLPESRTGNILMRPTLRAYEIPYLAKSTLDTEHQLPLEDLCISMQGLNRVVLKSKKLGKEVIPRLTNAHNFSYKSLPVYHFLCDLQTQGLREGIGIHWGALAGEFDFLPRIEFEDLILYDATWNIKKLAIKKMLDVAKDDAQLATETTQFVEANKLPQYVFLTDGDNELLVNFKNVSSVRMLLNVVKKRSHFKLTECLFGEEGIVKDEHQEYYANQVVVSFYNEHRLHQK